MFSSKTAFRQFRPVVSGGLKAGENPKRGAPMFTCRASWFTECYAEHEPEISDINEAFHRENGGCPNR